MTQDECLDSPHHWTSYGVCFEGMDDVVQLTGVNSISHIGTIGTYAVPEPSTGILMLGGLLAMALLRRFTCCR